MGRKRGRGRIRLLPELGDASGALISLILGNQSKRLTCDVN